MGQIEKPCQNIKWPLTANYDIDLHSIEFSLDLPSSFPYNIQIVIKQIGLFLKDSQPHPLQPFLTFSIDQRFSRYNTIDQTAFHKQKSIYSVISIDSTKFDTRGWGQLQTQQKFYQLLRHIEQQYSNQSLLQQLFHHSQSLSQLNKQNNSEGVSIRKPLMLVEKQGQQIQANLLKRLFYRYYQNVVKNYANTSSKERLLKFHHQIGKLLCLIVSKDFFQFSQLYQLVYCMVCVDKQGLQFNDKFEHLRKKYFKFCLQKKYVVDVQERRVKILQSAVRLYLDELYMSSLQQAQDPQIKATEDDLLNPTRIFPVQRVKEKYKG